MMTIRSSSASLQWMTRGFCMATAKRSWRSKTFTGGTENHQFRSSSTHFSPPCTYKDASRLRKNTLWLPRPDSRLNVSNYFSPAFAWRFQWNFCGSSRGPSRQMPRLLDDAWPSVCCVHGHRSSLWQSGGGIQMLPIPCLRPTNLPTGPPSPWSQGCRSWWCSLWTPAGSCSCTAFESFRTSLWSQVFRRACRDGSACRWNQPDCWDRSNSSIKVLPPQIIFF